MDEQHQYQQPSRGQLTKRNRWIIIFVGVLTLMISFVLIGYLWGWRGWLKVAIIPLAIAVISVLLTWWLTSRQLHAD